jgi:3-methylcrotonyl-CoA carboxylase alpha subunit
VRRNARFHRQGDRLDLYYEGSTFNLRIEPDYQLDKNANHNQDQMTAPMPGKVIEVLVKVADRVAKGDTLLILEAMKMEHRIIAPKDGVIATLPYAVGDAVEEHAQLATLKT